MALTDPNDVCKIAYDGNLPMLQMKIKEDRSLATKTDEVWIYAYFCRLFRRLFNFFHHKKQSCFQMCIVMHVSVAVKCITRSVVQ